MTTNGTDYQDETNVSVAEAAQPVPQWAWEAAGVEWDVVADDPFEVSLMMSATADGETVGLCELPLRPMELRRLHTELGKAVDAQRAVDGLPPASTTEQLTAPELTADHEIAEGVAEGLELDEESKNQRRLRKLTDPAGAGKVAATLDDRLPTFRGIAPSTMVFLAFAALTTLLWVLAWIF